MQVASLGPLYFLYRAGTGGIVGTVITICIFFIRSLYKSGAIDSKTTLPEGSALRPRSFVRDALIGVASWVLAFLWHIAGVELEKRKILADNDLTAGLIVVPAVILILVGSFMGYRVLNGFIFGRRR